MLQPTRDDLVLLRDCTASVDMKLDCERAMRGDEEAMERCAVVIRRARPNQYEKFSWRAEDVEVD